MRRVIAWYFSHIFGRFEGSGIIPFYCDPEEVGLFAISPAALSQGDDAAIFRLFVGLSMYQALRDEVIRKRQRKLPQSLVEAIANSVFVGNAISKHQCVALKSTEEFEQNCDVQKNDAIVDCGRQAGLPCHVKQATLAFNRMGDMGKLPTSAWLRLWKDDGLTKTLSEVLSAEIEPTKRAELLVDKFGSIHRVGRKLATMFVSALSTSALAPGLTPWFPEVDGNELVVVDTNVARAVDLLHSSGTSKTYDSRVAWIMNQAAEIDLKEYCLEVPSYSPRLVQQALYTFCSKSNRIARGDSCSIHQGDCLRCAPVICPFVTGFSPKASAI